MKKIVRYVTFKDSNRTPCKVTYNRDMDIKAETEQEFLTDFEIHKKEGFKKFYDPKNPPIPIDLSGNTMPAEIKCCVKGVEFKTKRFGDKYLHIWKLVETNKLSKNGKPIFKWVFCSAAFMTRAKTQKGVYTSLVKFVEKN